MPSGQSIPCPPRVATRNVSSHCQETGGKLSQAESCWFREKLTSVHSTRPLCGGRSGLGCRVKVQVPKTWFFWLVPCSARLRLSISLVLFVLCLKLFPTLWAAHPRSPWALPGRWFLWAGPCWWWPGAVGGPKPDGTPPFPYQA